MLPISIQNANMVCVCLIDYHPCTHLHVLDDVNKHFSQQRVHGSMSAVAGGTHGSQDVLLNGVSFIYQMKLFMKLWLLLCKLKIQNVHCEKFWRFHFWVKKKRWPWRTQICAFIRSALVLLLASTWPRPEDLLLNGFFFIWKMKLFMVLWLLLCKLRIQMIFVPNSGNSVIWQQKKRALQNTNNMCIYHIYSYKMSKCTTTNQTMKWSHELLVSCWRVPRTLHKTMSTTSNQHGCF